MEKIIQKHLIIPSQLEKLESSLLQEKQIDLYLKRDDQIHSDISGNKWRKLKYNLIQAKKDGIETLVSFGGNYSNHLVALAVAAHILKFKSIGYIRGDYINQKNPTIQFLLENNMELYPLSRTIFRNLNDKTLLENLSKKHNNSLIIPLGGTNKLALKGMKEMMDEIDQQLERYDYICTPIGSGGTAAGIIKYTNATTLVFNSFKKNFTKDLIHPIIGIDHQWDTINDYHFGGFAKTKPELLSFLNEFKSTYNIPLDYVYNGKMMFGLMKMIQSDYFKPGTKIVAIHTGGLQGNLYL